MSEQNSLILNWGIVSAGLISQDFCTALKSLKSEKHVIYAVSARKLEDAKSFAEKNNIGAFYDSYDKMFDDKNINIVYIGSVNHTHRELCLKAIAAGKHVLCEKPMSITCAEQEEVLTAAKQKKVFFMEGLWTRFFPVVHKIKEDLKNQTIGQLKYYIGNFFVNIKHVERLYKKELAGGGILDIGIYPIQLACLAFDHEKPLKITASGHLMPTGVDENCSITLLFSDQRIAQINISTNCDRFDRAFFVGDKGTIEIPAYIQAPVEYIKPDGTRVSIPLPECEKTHFSNSVGLRFQAEEIRVAIQNGLLEHPLVTHDNSRLIMQIMEEAKNQIGYKS